MDEVQGADQTAPQGTPTGAPLDVAPGTERARSADSTSRRRLLSFPFGGLRLGPPQVDRLHPTGWETGMGTRASRVPSRAASYNEQREEGPYRGHAHRDDDNFSDRVVRSYGFAGNAGDPAAGDAQASGEARRGDAARDGDKTSLPPLDEIIAEAHELQITEAEAEEQATQWARSLTKEQKRNVEVLIHTLHQKYPDFVCARAKMILMRAYDSLGNNSLGKDNAPKTEEAARVIMKEIRKDSTLRQLAANDKDGRSFFECGHQVMRTAQRYGVTYLIGLEFAGRRCDGQEHSNIYWLSHLDVNGAVEMGYERERIRMKSLDEMILWTIISVTYLHKQSDEVFKVKIQKAAGGDPRRGIAYVVEQLSDIVAPSSNLAIALLNEVEAKVRSVYQFRNWTIGGFADYLERTFQPLHASLPAEFWHTRIMDCLAVVLASAPSVTLAKHPCATEILELHRFLTHDKQRHLNIVADASSEPGKRCTPEAFIAALRNLDRHREANLANLGPIPTERTPRTSAWAVDGGAQAGRRRVSARKKCGNWGHVKPEDNHDPVDEDDEGEDGQDDDDDDGEDDEDDGEDDEDDDEDDEDDGEDNADEDDADENDGQRADVLKSSTSRVAARVVSILRTKALHVDQDFADELTDAITQAMGGESPRYAANVELPPPARGGRISRAHVLRPAPHEQVTAVDDNNKRAHEEAAHARAMVGTLLTNRGAPASAEH